ncbi:MAG: tetratricopeptide repeat protein [Janthinobacterium lividum]
MTKLLFAFLLFGAFLSSDAHAAPSAAQQKIQADGIVAGIVDKLWTQTDVYWHAGDYPRIVAVDRLITEADPQFLEAYSNGGWLMDSLGRTQDAEAYYTLGTRNNPHAEYAFWNLGFFYFNTPHNYPAAARAFRSAVQQPEADLRDWKMLAHSYEKSGQWDDAVSTWQQIRARYPQGLSVDRLLAEAVQNRQRVLRGEKPTP